MVWGFSSLRHRYLRLLRCIRNDLSNYLSMVNRRADCLRSGSPLIDISILKPKEGGKAPSLFDGANGAPPLSG